MQYREKEPRIEQLLSNEYQRIWWQEKLAWDKTVTAKKIASKKILPRKVNNYYKIIDGVIIKLEVYTDD